MLIYKSCIGFDLSFIFSEVLIHYGSLFASREELQGLRPQGWLSSNVRHEMNSDPTNNFVVEFNITILYFIFL